MQQDKAAIVIQTAWREHFQFFTTKHIVDNFMNHGLTSDLAKSIQLDDLVTKLRNPDLVSASEFVLKRVHSISGSKIESKPNVFRVFLSGYMIAYHPSSIFESVGPLEQALLDASTPMIDSFERICGEVVLQRKALREIVAEFPRVFKKYLECFEGWKTPDENKMGLRIKHALLALYNAQTRLPPNEDDRLCQVIYCFLFSPETSKLTYKPTQEVHTQITRLRDKLERICGAKALVEFDLQRNSSNKDQTEENSRQSRFERVVFPSGVTNEQLAHELLLDPEFQLTPDFGKDLFVFEQIRGDFQQAFWNSIADDMQLTPEPCYTRANKVMKEISDGLVVFSSGENVQDLLDDLQVPTSIDACMILTNRVLDVIRTIQSNNRREETEFKWIESRAEMRSAATVPRAVCVALEFLLDRVNALKIDAVNLRLRLIASAIKEHGADCERLRFQDKLNKGTMLLTRTERFFSSAFFFVY